MGFGAFSIPCCCDIPLCICIDTPPETLQLTLIDVVDLGVAGKCSACDSVNDVYTLNFFGSRAPAVEDAPNAEYIDAEARLTTWGFPTDFNVRLTSPICIWALKDPWDSGSILCPGGNGASPTDYIIFVTWTDDTTGNAAWGIFIFITFVTLGYYDAWYDTAILDTPTITCATLEAIFTGLTNFSDTICEDPDSNPLVACLCDFTNATATVAA